VPLTRTEFDLLQALVTAPRRVLTRTHLVEVVWGPGGADPHVVDVHVGNLRRKIRAADPSPERFVTVRGVGYRFQPGAA
jgi:DNA-binding response OmpR family regulator